MTGASKVGWNRTGCPRLCVVCGKSFVVARAGQWTCSGECLRTTVGRAADSDELEDSDPHETAPSLGAYEPGLSEAERARRALSTPTGKALYQLPDTRTDPRLRAAGRLLEVASELEAPESLEVALLARDFLDRVLDAHVPDGPPGVSGPDDLSGGDGGLGASETDA